MEPEPTATPKRLQRSLDLPAPLVERIEAYRQREGFADWPIAFTLRRLLERGLAAEGVK